MKNSSRLTIFPFHEWNDEQNIKHDGNHMKLYKFDKTSSREYNYFKLF